MKDKISNDFRRKHRTEWHEFLWAKFLKQFPDTKSRKSINGLLSDYEKRLITKRLAALALIQEGASTTEISSLLWLSRATISALKKSILNMRGVYKSQRSNKMNRQHSKAQTDSEKIILPENWLGDLSIWEIIKNPPRPWYRN